MHYRVTAARRRAFGRYLRALDALLKAGGASPVSAT